MGSVTSSCHDEDLGEASKKESTLKTFDSNLTLTSRNSFLDCVSEQAKKEDYVESVLPNRIWSRNFRPQTKVTFGYFPSHFPRGEAELLSLKLSWLFCCCICCIKTLYCTLNCLYHVLCVTRTLKILLVFKI